jgi:hypothetical protein
MKKTIQQFKQLPILASAVWALTAGASIAQTIPTGHPRIMVSEIPRLQADLAAQVPAATRFKSYVDNKLGVADQYYDPRNSALMGLVTGQPQYCADAASRMEAYVARDEALIATFPPNYDASRDGGAKIPHAGRDSYLETDFYVGTTMLVYDWCHSTLTASQKTRWANYANLVLTNLWDQPNARWNGNLYPGSNWSVNNPFNNYQYHFLNATMLYGLAAKHDLFNADQWLTRFRTTQVQNLLLPKLTNNIPGGGSLEGFGYGTTLKLLFHNYYLWEKTTGESIASLTPHTAATMPYMLHGLSPGRNFLAPIGDQSRDSTAAFYDYHRELLLAVSSLFPNDAVSRRVRTTLPLTSVTRMGAGNNFIWDFLYPAIPAGAPAQLNTTYHALGTGYLFTRSGWDTGASWLTFVVPLLSESHAHSDGLSLLLYKNGWLVSDAVTQSGSGLQQDLDSHGLVSQKIGNTYVRMFALDDLSSKAAMKRLATKREYFYAAADQGSLYTHPQSGNPGLRSEREIVQIKPDVVIVYDRAGYTAGATTKTFQLPTQYLPTINGRTATVSNGQSSMTVHALSPVNSTFSVTDMRSVDTDFRGGYRIDSAINNSTLTRFLNVISIDGAATAVTPGANDSEVSLVLKDGRQVKVSFNRDVIGGSIEILDSTGSVIISEPLPTGVASTPLTVATAFLKAAKTGSGQGNVTSASAGINCGAACTATPAAGSSVTLTATANPGARFVGWQGGYCSGTGTCNLTMDDARYITARFDLDNEPPRRAAVPNDLNGDASADLIFRHSGTGQLNAWLMSGTVSTGAAALVAAGNWTVSHSADFSGDLKSDLLFRNDDGSVSMWLMDGLSATKSAGLLGADPDWRVSHVADFNGDGKADILWRHTNGSVTVWLMDGTTVVNAVGLLGANADWRVTHVGDFDGDGKADLLWRNTNGAVTQWLMNGTTVAAATGLLGADPGWRVTHVADFNSDGKADLLWGNTNGAVTQWLMNGTVVAGSVGLLGANADWRVSHVGDFDGDGKADLLWRNTNGAVTQWLMNGTTVALATGLLGANADWRVTHVGDHNADGRADILWRRINDGSISMWLMNGPVAVGSAAILGPSPWYVVPE